MNRFEILKKVLGWYTRLFALWIILFAIVGYYRPGPFLAVKAYNKWFFALTMFGIGAVLRIEDFRDIACRPVIVAIGSAAQFTIMPLGAFALAKLFRLPDELAVGLIIAGCAPGAMSSNVMSYIAKADTAYSVSLTTISTMLCPLLTPGLTYLLLSGSAVKVPVLDMFLDILWMVILPLGAGFGIRHFFAQTIEKIKEVFPAISVTFIIFICSLVIAANRDRLLQLTLAVFAVVVLLNAFGMAAGYGTGMLFGMPTRQRRTLSIEIGMQNAGLGTVLAIENFGPRAAIPTALFVFVCIITASIMVELWKERSAPTEDTTHVRHNTKKDC